jgi:hypothetical protein
VSESLSRSVPGVTDPPGFAGLVTPAGSVQRAAGPAVRDVWRVELGPGPADAVDPRLRQYFVDMLAAAGERFDEPRYTRGKRNSFADLMAALLAARSPQDLDLVVLAHSLPDCDPCICTAGSMQDHPGTPMTFAIGDMGVAAPFVAVTAAQAYHAPPECSRILVAMLDQSTLPYAEPAVGGVGGDHAVAIRLASDGAAVLGPVRGHIGVAPDAVAEQLAAELEELVGNDGCTLIAGNGVAPVNRPQSGVTVLTCAADQPATGPWSVLADGWPHWRGRRRRVVIADYEPDRGYLCVLPIDFDPQRADGER